MNARLYLEAVRQLPISGAESLIGDRTAVILSPHPDDDALGAGGLIAASSAAGRRVVVVVLTDGSGSHPNSQRYPRERLISLRKSEALLAAEALGLPAADLHHLDLPDGALPSRGEVFEHAVDALEAVVSGVEVASIFVTWEHDPHPDHRAAACMARGLRERRPSLKIWQYPIWGWHLDPATCIEETQPRGYRLDVTSWLDAKRAAIAAHASQMTDLIDDDPQGFHFDAASVAPFLGHFEYFLDAG